MPQKPFSKKASHDGLTVVAYAGDGSVLLAFDLADKPKVDFAGFAVHCIPPQGKPFFLLNRLNFSNPVSSGTMPQKRPFTPSDQAPFQKFRWVYIPSELLAGKYTYQVTTMHYRNSGLKKGSSTAISLEMTPEKFENFDIGFTRGYLSSQAYASKFKNASVRPAGKKTLDFDTSEFEGRYDWLGFHARKLLFSFLNEAVNDPSINLDVFAYDIDEPDVVRLLEKFGTRLRIFLDNAALHTGSSALEPQAWDRLRAMAGQDHVKLGHFQRFAHNKIMIQKKNGQPTKVLTGSANFSVRGLYVQANNILVFEDPEVAGLYEQAFNQAFNDPTKSQSKFDDSRIASRYFEVNVAGSPKCKIAFSPHKDSMISLSMVADEIKRADRSVLFAIMELGGKGPVLDQIRKLNTTTVFSYGVTQSSGSLGVFKPGSNRSKVVPFAFLKDKVPEPFKQEFSGGPGQVVHHKFVAVDFNDSDPVLFAGSSNLAAGGEKANGDNLIAIFDRGIATAYSVEAIRLLDHYDFRQKMKSAKKAKPLLLQGPEGTKRWWEPYYDENHIKFKDRMLFSHPADEA